MNQVYRVVVTREDENWLADVPDVEGTHTYAKSLMKLETEVREAIAAALDLNFEAERALTLDWEIHTGNDALDERAAKLRKVRQAVAKTEQWLQEESTPVVGSYRGEAELSVRDTAFLTGLSYQRISQMA